MKDRKDHIIEALTEMVQELTNRILSIRVAAALEIEKREEQLKDRDVQKPSEQPQSNGSGQHLEDRPAP